MNPLSAEERRLVDDLVLECLDQPDELQSSWLDNLEAPSAIVAAVRHRLEAAEAEDVIDRVKGKLAGAVVGISGGVIDSYRLVRVFAEGGMATVFLAEQVAGGFARQVAVKVLRTGIYDELRKHMFFREQRALARLSHPNIGSILDAGVADSGMPYLVMEFVDGTPITRFADERRLSVSQRLALFDTVCEAVAYAHANLVIHRDIKPSNILVRGDGEVKLLNFGIAKLVGDEEEPTQAGQQHFTPGYAAPEQQMGGPVTVATDVYGLGVLLHELLTGRRPFFTEDGLAYRASAAAGLAQGASTSAQRGMTPRQLQRRLRGDLDAAIARAIRPAAMDRYGSVAELRDDLRRHAEGRPLRALNEPAFKRAVRWVKRHRYSVGSATAVIVVLVAAALFSLDQARQKAEEAARAEATAGFLSAILSAAEPDTRTRETVDELLDRATHDAEISFHNATGSLTEVLRTIGDVQRQRGAMPAARAALTRAQDLAQHEYAADSERLLAIAIALARVDEAEGQPEAGLSRLTPLLAPHLSERRPSAVVVDGIRQLAQLQLRKGDLASALQYARQAVAATERGFPDTPKERIASLLVLTDVCSERSEWDQAMQAAQSALQLAETQYGEHHIQYANVLVLIGNIHRARNELDQAEATLRHAAAISQQVHPKPHSNTVVILNDLAVVLSLEQRRAQAAEIFEQVLAIQEQIYRPDHPNISQTQANIAGLRLMEGDYRSSVDLSQRSLSSMIKERGEAHPRLAGPYRSLGKALLASADTDGARAAAARARDIDAQHHGESSVDVASDELLLAQIERRAGALDSARSHLTAAKTVLFRDTSKSPASLRMTALLTEADVLLDQRQFQEAQRVLDTLLVQTEGPPLQRDLQISALSDRVLAKLGDGRTADAAADIQRIDALIAGGNPDARVRERASQAKAEWAKRTTTPQS